MQFRQVKSDIANASRVAYEFMTGLGQKTKVKQNPRLLIRTEAALGSRVIGSRTLSQPGAKPSTTSANCPREAGDDSPLHGHDDRELSE